MEPLNSKERTMALVKFLALFLVTVILICWAIYYDTRIPSAQLAQLKAENSMLRSSYNEQKDALTTMDSIYSGLLSYPTAQIKSVVEAKIGRNIEALSKMGDADSASFLNKVTERAAAAYILNLADKKDIDTKSKSGQDLLDKDKKIADLKEEAEKKDKEIQNLNIKLMRCGN